MKKKVSLTKTEQIQKLLKGGHDPEVIAYDVGCSKQYVYNIRAKMNKGKTTGVDAPAPKRKVKEAPKVGGTLKRQAEIRNAVAKVNARGSKKEVLLTAKPKKEVIQCITNVGNLVTVTIVRNPTPEQRNSFLEALKKAL